MDHIIFNPVESYHTQLQKLHAGNTDAFFQELVQRSGINIEENRQTVQQYEQCLTAFGTLKKKRNLLRFLRVLMCITVLLIPVVIFKLTPKIRALKEEMDTLDARAKELLELANRQMSPLNALFTDKDALRIIESVLPLIRFEPYLSAEQEQDMKLNYDFCDNSDNERSTLDVLSGRYNDNPFVFENRLIHTMGTEVYHGYKTISWTETYRDSNGKLQTRTRTETLHATVTKPKPFYNTQVVLHYGAQGAPELSFSRDATHLDRKSERALERYVSRGEKKLKRKADRALKKNEDFVSMSNTEFEVLFDALDRTDEVQFRSLFTPLAQTNMVELITSDVGYGDDFDFIKRRRMNHISSTHSQNRHLILTPDLYTSYSYDVIQANFTTQNTDFFKAVYFDLAPILAIPAYQERPVHSLMPVPDHTQMYSYKECEALANAVPASLVVHPNTKTSAIIKSAYLSSQGKTDQAQISAFSYDIEGRVDYVSMLGGDGRYHSVAVPWDEYLPLMAHNTFCFADIETAAGHEVVASRNGLCIFKK